MASAEGFSSVSSSLTMEQYASLFRKRPQLAAGHIRRAFAERNPQFPIILGSISILVTGTMSERLDVFVNKVIETLMVLTSDKTVYEARELRNPQAFVCNHIPPTVHSWKLPNGFSNSLQSYVEPYGTTGAFFITTKKFEGSSALEGIMIPEIALRGRLAALYSIYACSTNSSDLKHLPWIRFTLTLYCFFFVYGPKYSPDSQRAIMVYLSALIFSLGDGGIDAFVKETLSKTDETKIHPKDLSSRLIALLQSSEEPNKDLQAYLFVITEFSRVPEIFERVQSDPQGWGPGLAESICIACQRQLCSGDTEFDNNVVEYCIRTLPLLLPLSHPRGVLTLMALTNSHAVFILVGRGLVIAAKKDDESLRDECARLLYWNASIGGLADRISAVIKVKLSELCLVPWSHILAELRTLVEHGPNNTAALALRNWESFGASIGLTEATAKIALKRRRDYVINLMNSGNPSSKTPGCCWFGCVCTSFPRHHRLRRCKGCQTFVYCSRKCQEKDWNEGHRDVCTRAALSH